MKNGMTSLAPTDEDFEYYRKLPIVADSFSNSSVSTPPSSPPASTALSNMSPTPTTPTASMPNESEVLDSPGLDPGPSNSPISLCPLSPSTSSQNFDSSADPGCSPSPVPIPSSQSSDVLAGCHDLNLMQNHHCLGVQGQFAQPDWMVDQLKAFCWPPKHWLNPKAPWNYLLHMKDFVPGKLIRSLQGKLLLIVAGQVKDILLSMIMV